MKKSILILNWRCPTNPRAGGAEMITHTHAQAWVHAGYVVVWFAERYRDSKAYEKIDGIHIYRMGIEHSLHSIIAPFAYLIFLLNVVLNYWISFRGKFDLVIDEVHGPIYWTTFWAWRSKKLIYVHEVAQDIWDKMLPWPMNAIGKTAEKLMYYTYRNVPFLTASISTRDDLVAFGVPQKKITLIPHGIDLQPLSKPFKKKSPLKLIFVARLVKMKGVEDAITVLKKVTQTIPDAQLWIVGNGETAYLEKLRNRVSQIALEKNVHFTGFIDRLEQIALYQKAHFLIHTSVREGFGLVVVEANSQGTPALVFDSPGLRDIVVNGVNGYVSPYGDTDALADTVVRLYNDHDAYKNLQDTSLKQSRLYKWNEITRLSIDYIEKCLKN